MTYGDKEYQKGPFFDPVSETYGEWNFRKTLFCKDLQQNESTQLYLLPNRKTGIKTACS